MEHMKETLRDRYVRTRHVVLAFLYMVRVYIVRKAHRAAFRVYTWTWQWLASHNEPEINLLLPFMADSLNDRYDRLPIDRY